MTHENNIVVYACKCTDSTASQKWNQIFYFKFHYQSKNAFSSMHDSLVFVWQVMNPIAISAHFFSYWRKWWTFIKLEDNLFIYNFSSHLDLDQLYIASLYSPIHTRMALSGACRVPPQEQPSCIIKLFRVHHVAQGHFVKPPTLQITRRPLFHLSRSHKRQA